MTLDELAAVQGGRIVMQSDGPRELGTVLVRGDDPDGVRLRLVAEASREDAARQNRVAGSRKKVRSWATHFYWAEALD